MNLKHSKSVAGAGDTMSKSNVPKNANNLKMSRVQSQVNPNFLSSRDKTLKSTGTKKNQQESENESMAALVGKRFTLQTAVSKFKTNTGKKKKEESLDNSLSKHNNSTPSFHSDESLKDEIYLKDESFQQVEKSKTHQSPFVQALQEKSNSSQEKATENNADILQPLTQSSLAKNSKDVESQQSMRPLMRLNKTASNRMFSANIRRQAYKKECALQEFNHGLILEKLKFDPKEWERLREYLRAGHKDLEKCVQNGSAPLFGYPIVCYSPIVEENQKDHISGTDAWQQCRSRSREKFRMFLQHVFNTNPDLPNMSDVYYAAQVSDRKQQDLFKRLTRGAKAVQKVPIIRDFLGRPIVSNRTEENQMDKNNIDIRISTHKTAGNKKKDKANSKAALNASMTRLFKQNTIIAQENEQSKTQEGIKSKRKLRANVQHSQGKEVKKLSNLFDIPVESVSPAEESSSLGRASISPQSKQLLTKSQSVQAIHQQKNNLADRKLGQKLEQNPNASSRQSGISQAPQGSKQTLFPKGHFTLLSNNSARQLTRISSSLKTIPCKNSNTQGLNTSRQEISKVDEKDTHNFLDKSRTTCDLKVSDKFSTKYNIFDEIVVEQADVRLKAPDLDPTLQKNYIITKIEVCEEDQHPINITKYSDSQKANLNFNGLVKIAEDNDYRLSAFAQQRMSHKVLPSQLKFDDQTFRSSRLISGSKPHSNRLVQSAEFIGGIKNSDINVSQQAENQRDQHMEIDQVKIAAKLRQNLRKHRRQKQKIDSEMRYRRKQILEQIMHCVPSSCASAGHTTQATSLHAKEHPTQAHSNRAVIAPALDKHAIRITESYTQNAIPICKTQRQLRLKSARCGRVLNSQTRQINDASKTRPSSGLMQTTIGLLNQKKDEHTAARFASESANRKKIIDTYK